METQSREGTSEARAWPLPNTAGPSCHDLMLKQEPIETSDVFVEICFCPRPEEYAWKASLPSDMHLDGKPEDSEEMYTWVCGGGLPS